MQSWFRLQMSTCLKLSVMCHYNGTNINVAIVKTHHHSGTLTIEDCNTKNMT
jgi:hypothetical protein